MTFEASDFQLATVAFSFSFDHERDQMTLTKLTFYLIL